MIHRSADKITIATSLLFFIFILKCANQLPPTGGDVDKIPPTIIEVFPLSGTTNFDKDYFEIEFSEYVDKRTVRDAIFISPFIEGSLEFSWIGTTLQVTFPEELKKDVTYTITIGTDIVDLNNRNRMAQAFTFSFSTGDKIDKKIISGKVYGKQKEGIFIFAYKLENGSDSLLNSKPDYASQTGVDGNFRLEGLGSGKYRVFAVNDKFRDYLFQSEQDEIGIPSKDIVLTESDSIYSDLNLFLFNADNSKPRLIGGVMTDKNHLLVTCSKEIDPTILQPWNFSLIDSTDNKEYKIQYTFNGKTKPEEFILMFDAELNPSNQVFLTADTLMDLLGNLMMNDFTQIIVSDRVDTSSIKINSTLPAQNGVISSEKPEVKIFFDEAFDKELVKSAITLTDTINNRINFNIEYYDDATLVIKPVDKLKTEKDYLLKLQLGKFVDIAGNSTDSLFTLKFKTNSGLEFTGLSGKVLNLDYSRNPVLILENGETPNLKYDQELITENFEFSRIEPGKYVLWCFLDENNDGEFNFGSIEPINFSETFSVYPDTINLRPRWEITDLNFKFR